MLYCFLRSAFLDALDVREALVGSENQRGGRNDLREREKQGERGTFGQALCFILYRLAQQAGSVGRRSGSRG
ncbi:UNVERIFIED_CONTAM: hypothetical protein FKN15_054256 [Acipenser sinensis]